MIDSHKGEVTLNINDYNDSDVKEGKDGTMINILNIIFGDEYMIPSVPEKTGLFIQQYRFEFIEDAIQKIQTNLLELIEKYIPDSTIKDVLVIQKDKYTIGIGIEFMNDRIDDLTNAENVKDLERRISVLQIKESGKGYKIDILR